MCSKAGACSYCCTPPVGLTYVCKVAHFDVMRVTRYPAQACCGAFACTPTVHHGNIDCCSWIQHRPRDTPRVTSSRLLRMQSRLAKMTYQPQHHQSRSHAQRLMIRRGTSGTAGIRRTGAGGMAGIHQTGTGAHQIGVSHTRKRRRVARTAVRRTARTRRRTSTRARRQTNMTRTDLAETVAPQRPTSTWSTRMGLDGLSQLHGFRGKPIGHRMGVLRLGAAPLHGTIQGHGVKRHTGVKADTIVCKSGLDDLVQLQQCSPCNLEVQR